MQLVSTLTRGALATNLATAIFPLEGQDLYVVELKFSVSSEQKASQNYRQLVVV